MMDWMPIETATKDGTDILLAGIVGGVARQKVGWYQDGAWVTAILKSGRRAWFEEPTHWKPLGAAPEFDCMSGGSHAQASNQAMR